MDDILCEVENETKMSNFNAHVPNVMIVKLLILTCCLVILILHFIKKLKFFVL